MSTEQLTAVNGMQMLVVTGDLAMHAAKRLFAYELYTSFEEQTRPRRYEVRRHLLRSSAPSQQLPSSAKRCWREPPPNAPYLVQP